MCPSPPLLDIGEQLKTAMVASMERLPWHAINSIYLPCLQDEEQEAYHHR